MNKQVNHPQNKSWKKRIASFFLRSIIRLLAFVSIFPGTPMFRLAKRLDLFRLLHVDFVLRPDDIFVVSYGRSGTTLVQHILYQLTTDGNLDFTHIYEVSPWFDNRREPVFNKDYEELPSPRVFKSHLPYHQIPKDHEAGRYIYVVRDGRDVAVSIFHFSTTFLRYKKTFSEFFDHDFLNRQDRESGNWFEHVDEWSAHRNQPNILFLKYEDLIQDLEGGIKKIIAFCEFEVEPKRLSEIAHKCSFAYMQKNESKFNRFIHYAKYRPEWKREHQFIRKGKSGGWIDYLSDEQNAKFKEKFEKTVGQGLDLGVDIVLK